MPSDTNNNYGLRRQYETGFYAFDRRPASAFRTRKARSIETRRSLHSSGPLRSGKRAIHGKRSSVTLMSRAKKLSNRRPKRLPASRLRAKRKKAPLRKKRRVTMRATNRGGRGTSQTRRARQATVRRLNKKKRKPTRVPGAPEKRKRQRPDSAFTPTNTSL